MRILGIDPGYDRLGIAVLEKEDGWKKEKVIFSECFQTSSKLDFPKRLVLVGEELEKVIKKYKPEILAIETLFLNTNQKTAMQVSGARGLILYKAKKMGLEILEFSPPQIKNSVTGHGRSDKNQIIKMVKMLVEIPQNKKESDDELDAIAVSLTAFANLKNPYK